VKAAAWLGVTLGLAILTNWIYGAWINPSLAQAGLFLLVCIWCVTPHQVRGSVGLWPLAGAVTWGLAQLATGHTVSRWETWNATLMWAGNLAAFWLGLQICQEPRVRRALLRGLVVFAFAVSVVSLLQWFSAPTRIFWFYETGYPMFGPVGNRDQYAAFAELMIPVAVVEALWSERVKWFYAAAAATLFAAVIAGASRAGGALVVTEVIVLAMIVIWRRGVRWTKGIAVFAGMTCVFTAVVGVETLLERYGAADPYADREAYLKSAMAMVRERPGMGFGLGNWANAYPAYARVDVDKTINHAHNDWAEWAEDGGLPFLAFMVAMAIWVAPKAVSSVWGIGILVVMTHAIVDFPFRNPATAMWVFSLIGVLAAETGYGGAQTSGEPIHKPVDYGGPEW
jgi:O-antigen ligase